jgi:hypothetical protein
VLAFGLATQLGSVEVAVLGFSLLLLVILALAGRRLWTAAVIAATPGD